MTAAFKDKKLRFRDQLMDCVAAGRGDNGAPAPVQDEPWHGEAFDRIGKVAIGYFFTVSPWSWSLSKCGAKSSVRAMSAGDGADRTS